ncbi:glycosyltransferase [Bradyrhizobium sp. RT5a]|jgi:GT2 family glycosyltransferase|uniref:glycosyltransferase family 2 protein n=1 Tax=Bradyrhizobium sp. RT5a TaxID=3156380 RepID=UPI00339A577C
MIRLQAPWRIQHIDLAQPLDPISVCEGEGGVYVVLWCNDVPLGITSFLAAQLPILPEAFSALIPSIIAAPLGNRIWPHSFPPALRLHKTLPQPLASGSLGEVLSDTHVLNRFAQACDELETAGLGETISVVICTRDRPQVLKRCLDSFGPIMGDLREIIVVDNAPTSGDVAEIAKGRVNVRYVAEGRQGLSIARNTGMRAATGSIIAFTDDDVMVHRKWAKRIRAAFSSPEILSVTGLVLPAELRTTSQLAFEIELGGFGRGLQCQRFRDQVFRPMIPFGPPVWHVGAGANMAIRRSALQAVGGFDERLGAGAAGCSEDSEYWYRVLAAGYDCYYDPAIVVYHEHRHSPAQLKSQMRAYMKGHVSALLVQYARHGHAGNLRRVFATLPWYYALQILAALRPSHWRRWSLLAPQLAGYIAGFQALRWFWRNDPSSRPWTFEGFT